MLYRWWKSSRVHRHACEAEPVVFRSTGDLGISRSGQRRGFDRFRTDERGSVTVEYTLWLVFFVMLFVAIADLSLTFYSYSRMWDVARDATRRVATGQMDAESARIYAEEKLGDMIAFTVTVDDTDVTDVVVTISAPGDVLKVGGFIDMFTLDSLTAIYTMRKEQVS